jgi:hypothetical protein
LEEFEGWRREAGGSLEGIERLKAKGERYVEGIACLVSYASAFLIKSAIKGKG